MWTVIVPCFLLTSTSPGVVGLLGFMLASVIITSLLSRLVLLDGQERKARISRLISSAGFCQTIRPSFLVSFLEYVALSGWGCCRGLSLPLMYRGMFDSNKLLLS